ncbi:MAG TPA: histidine phosphatase family protein [Bryobacteraceae bacterium]|nr:histidine phosphatase family protein [Bryobacteraceae bacterium]
MGSLTLVRHGQASFLQPNYDKLSRLGEEQARKLGEYWLKTGVRFDHSFHGPAHRQVHTGDIVAQTYREAGESWPDSSCIPELDEYPGIEVVRAFLPELIDKHEDMRLLDEEFRTAADRSVAARAFEKMFQRVTRLWVAGELDSPDVETWQSFCERVEVGIERARSVGGRVAVFTSGGVIAATVRIALDLSPQRTLELSWAPRNASYAEFLFSPERFSLSSFNVYPHLDTPDLLTWR